MSTAQGATELKLQPPNLSAPSDSSHLLACAAHNLFVSAGTRATATLALSRKRILNVNYTALFPFPNTNALSHNLVSKFQGKEKQLMLLGEFVQS